MSETVIIGLLVATNIMGFGCYFLERQHSKQLESYIDRTLNYMRNN